MARRIRKTVKGCDQKEKVRQRATLCRLTIHTSFPRQRKHSINEFGRQHFVTVIVYEHSQSNSLRDRERLEKDSLGELIKSNFQYYRLVRENTLDL